MDFDGKSFKDEQKVRSIKRRSFDWLILRKVVCDRYFQGRSAEHCADCKERTVCFQMIEDVFDLVASFKVGKNKTSQKK